MRIQPGDLVRPSFDHLSYGWANVPSDLCHHQSMVQTFTSKHQLGLVIYAFLQHKRGWAYVMTSTASSWFMTSELKTIDE